MPAGKGERDRNIYRGKVGHARSFPWSRVGALAFLPLSLSSLTITARQVQRAYYIRLTSLSRTRCFDMQLLHLSVVILAATLVIVDVVVVVVADPPPFPCTYTAKSSLKVSSVYHHGGVVVCGLIITCRTAGRLTLLMYRNERYDTYSMTCPTCGATLQRVRRTLLLPMDRPSMCTLLLSTYISLSTLTTLMPCASLRFLHSAMFAARL